MQMQIVAEARVVTKYAKDETQSKYRPWKVFASENERAKQMANHGSE